MTTIFVREGTSLPERASDDLYPTPKTLIVAALQRFMPHYPQIILDIGAGDGRWGNAAFDMAFNAPTIVAGIEIRDLPMPRAFDHWYPNQDFLTWNTTNRETDLILSNPPYYIAEPVIRHSWELLAPTGTMIMLLRLDFAGSINRYHGLWNEIWPVEVSVCSRRPSFYGGGTNGTTYGIYVWKKDQMGNPVGEPRTWRTSLLMYERATKNKNRDN